MHRPYAEVFDGTRKAKLDKVDPDAAAGLAKGGGVARVERLGEELAELANVLAFAGQHALLVILQGRDASGKDGVIRKVLDFSNVLKVRVESFKAPTEVERNHDFLWRIHQVTPSRGQIALFNRSHYEDVIAARV